LSEDRLVSQDGRVRFEVAFSDGGVPADIEITLSGAPTPESFASLNRRLTDDPRFRARMTMLVDCSALDTSALSEQALEGLSQPMLERDWHYPPAAVAIIAPDEMTYTAVRAYRAHLGGTQSNRYVFRSRTEAVAWLEQQKPA
jgi:hypothetical protein